MAMSMNSSGGGGGRRGGRGRGLNAEINVTPFVDVMLVLLIVFMITAPLLTTGIDVTLPSATAKPLPSSEEVLALSITEDGTIYLQEQEISLEELQPTLRAIIESGEYDNRIFVRGDEVVPLGLVAEVFSQIQQAGVNSAAIVTDSNLK